MNFDYWNDLVLELADVNFLFVDDGSVDQTLRVLALFDFYPNVKTLSISDNVGKGEAVRIGFIETFARETLDNSEFNLIGFLDCDGAFAKSDIMQMIQVAKNLTTRGEYQAVISSRVKLLGRRIERSQLRHFIGRLIVTVISLGWADSPYDSQSGFKIFLITNEFKESMSNKFQTKWFFDVEILSRLKRGSIFEFPLNEWHEVRGSHLKFTSAMSVCFEIVKVRREIIRNRKSF